MKKICYVVTTPGTIRAFFVRQINYLAHNGYDVTVICSYEEYIKSILDEKVRYISVNIPRGISVIGSVMAVKGLFRIFRREKFDLIQYSTPNAAFYASIAAKMVGCKIRNYHLMGFRYLGASGLEHKILKWIEKAACINSTSIECVSKSNLEIGVHERFFSQEKATVVWNGSTGGVDLERFNVNKRSVYRNEIRSKYRVYNDDFIFGFVGRITRDKGINEILEAFSHIKNAKLMMVGSPEAVETLDQNLYLESQSNPSIIYTGRVSDVEKYFAAMDVLLFPSYREGFGNVVIEAAAMGTPAIVSNIPGPIDAIQSGVTALVVEAKNSQSLLNEMKKIQLLDYNEMGRIASKFVREKFDSEILCEKILDRKKDLLG